MSQIRVIITSYRTPLVSWMKCSSTLTKIHLCCRFSGAFKLPSIIRSRKGRLLSWGSSFVAEAIDHLCLGSSEEGPKTTWLRIISSMKATLVRRKLAQNKFLFWDRMIGRRGGRTPLIHRIVKDNSLPLSIGDSWSPRWKALTSHCAFDGATGFARPCNPYSLY